MVRIGEIHAYSRAAKTYRATLVVGRAFLMNYCHHSHESSCYTAH